VADSLQTMLDFRDISASYRNAPTMVGTPMLDTFWSDVKSTVSDDVTIFSLTRSNVPNPANTRGSMPKRQNGPGASKKSFSLFNSFNELTMPNDTLRFLRSNDPGIRQIGQEWVAATIEEAGRRQKLLREVLVGQAMTFGVSCLDSNFDPIMPTVHATTGALTTTGAAVVADYQVADSHRGNCGSLTTGAWDTTTTDIFQELEGFRDASVKAGSEAPNTVYINRLRLPKLLLNTKFQAWATLNKVTNEQVINSGKITNYFGWNIVGVEGYWTSAGGTQYPLIPLRQAIICPPNGPWKRCVEGTQDVPTTLGVFDNLESALATMKPVVGMFGFAQVKVTPLAQCSLYLGDNFGLGFANPNSIYMPTVFSA